MFCFGKADTLPMRKDSVQQSRARTSTGEGPETHRESGDETGEAVEVEEQEGRGHSCRSPRWEPGRLEGTRCPSRLPHGQMAWLWRGGRNRGKDRTTSCAAIT